MMVLLGERSPRFTNAVVTVCMTATLRRACAAELLDGGVVRIDRQNGSAAIYRDSPWRRGTGVFRSAGAPACDEAAVGGVLRDGSRPMVVCDQHVPARIDGHPVDGFQGVPVVHEDPVAPELDDPSTIVRNEGAAVRTARRRSRILPS